MKTDIRYRLSASTVIEPLVNGWHAWSRLISPVPASLHLVNHQLPTLVSYLEDPEGHVRLARDPEFAGGTFCDIPPEEAHRVRQLLEATEREQAANIELARDVLNLHNLLQDGAKGQALAPFYGKVPARLRGLVELVYDYYNHPGVRFFEGLLYDSEYYTGRLQSLRIFRLDRDGERPFFMSTPRLVKSGEIDWQVPVNAAAVDEFMRLDLRPLPVGEILELLGLRPSDESKVLPHLAEGPPAVAERWEGDGVRVRYFGHACVLLEWKGVAILTDPCVTARPAGGGVDRFSFNDLPEKIDFALVTHDHQDHFSLETLLRLRGRVECLVVPKCTGLLHGDVSLKLMAKKLGFKHVADLDALESIPLPDGEIIAVPFLGEHGDLALSKTGYIVRAGKEQVLIAADSDCLDRAVYENVRKAVGRVGTVFLGTESVGAPLTWTNGPLFPRKPSREQDQTRRCHGCDSERGLNITEALGATRIYNYAMGKEPWLEYLLGLGLSEDAPQLRESRRLIQRGGARGFVAFDSPFGKCEMYLGRPNGAARSESLPSCLSYWGRQLGGARKMFCAHDEAGLLQADSAGATCTHSITLAARTCGGLAELSETCGHHIPVILLAAFQAALFKLTGEDDILIAAAFGNSPYAGCAAAGPASGEILFLRTDLSCNPSFLTLLARAEAVIDQALAHSAAPPATLLRHLSENEGMSPESLLQVMFAYDCQAPRVELPEGLSQSGTVAATALALLIDDTAGEIRAAIQYDTETLDSVTALLLLEQYRSVLEGAAWSPRRALADLVRLDEGPTRQPAFEETISANEDTEDQFAF